MTTLPEAIPLPPPPSMADPTNAETKKMKPKTAHHHQPWAIMITEAVTSLNERGGSSLPAIKKFVLSHNDVDDKQLTPHMRRGMNAALATGKLVQVKGHGLNGSFKLSKKKINKDKAAKENAPKMEKKKKSPKKDSAKKTTMKKAKSEKKVGTKKQMKAKKPKSPSPKNTKSDAPKVAGVKKSAAPATKKMKKKIISGVAKMKATKTPKMNKAPKPKTTKKMGSKPKAAMTPKAAKSPEKAKITKNTGAKPMPIRAGK